MTYVLIAYLTVAFLLGVFISVRQAFFWKLPSEFPEDFYTLLGYCLCWPFSVPYEVWTTIKDG